MSLYLFYVFSAVVGVKLNVSFWMNSFINATLKLNVSQFKRTSLEKNRRPFSLISSLAVFDNLERDLTVNYLSPELFTLPRIKCICKSYCIYRSTFLIIFWLTLYLLVQGRDLWLLEE